MPGVNYAAEQAIPVERLHEELIYSPTAGVLLHKRTKGTGGGKVFALQAAGNVRKDGYLQVSIGGRQFLSHRAIWAMQKGRWPDDDIDHVDRDKQNNRIGNLRVVTNAENIRNAGPRSTNNSGHAGVGWRKQYGKWRARIMVDGKMHELGLYENLSDAVLVRRIAESELWGGTHAFPDYDAKEAA